MELPEMQIALGSFSNQLAILQSYLSLKFGLEFQEFYDRSLSIVTANSKINPPQVTVTNEGNRRLSGGEGDVVGGHSSSSRCHTCPTSNVPETVIGKGPVENPLINVFQTQTEVNCTSDQETTNEEPHSTMEAGDEEGKEMQGILQQQQEEIEEELPFVSVKNEVNELEDVKIAVDLVGEDPFATLSVNSNAEYGNETGELDDDDDDDPLEIVGYDNTNDSNSESKDVRASQAKKGRRRKRQHKNDDSTDEEYKIEVDEHGSSTSDDEDEHSFWVMSQDGPVQTPRSSNNKHKQKKKVKKSGQSSKHSAKSKSEGKHTNKPCKVNNKSPTTNMSNKPKSIEYVCFYCRTPLELPEEQLSETRGTSGDVLCKKVPMCSSCKDKCQNTSDKLKNIWSSILPAKIKAPILKNCTKKI